MFDLRAAAVLWPDDRNDVESGSTFEQTVSLQIDQSEARQPLLFFEIDGFVRLAGDRRVAGFHFDEHDRAAVDGDDVDFADAELRAAADDFVAEAL